VDGRFHHITAAGLAPLPVQRPIPIWIGAFAPAALRRVGRIADGWFPMARPGGGLDEALEIVAEGAREVGRDPSTIAFEGRVDYTPGAPSASPSTRRTLARGGSQPRFGQHHARRAGGSRCAYRRPERGRRRRALRPRAGRRRAGAVHRAPGGLREWPGERRFGRVPGRAPGLVRRSRRRARAAMVGRLLLDGGHGPARRPLLHLRPRHRPTLRPPRPRPRTERRNRGFPGRATPGTWWDWSSGSPRGPGSP
jgi:hypothetical protein